jgi:hypothetical protein
MGAAPLEGVVDHAAVGDLGWRGWVIFEGLFLVVFVLIKTRTRHEEEPNARVCP